MLVRRRCEARPRMSMPFYVSPEQLMKDRADFARKGIARGRSVAVVRYADGVLFVSENPSAALHKISEIYDRIAFAAVGPLQRVREPPHRRRPAGRHARLLLRPARRDRPRAGQRLRPDPRHDLLQRGREALRDRDLRGRGRRLGRRRPGLPAHLRRPGRRGARLRRDGWRGRGGDDVPQGALHRRPLARRGPGPRGRRARAERDRAPRHPGARPRGRGARPHPHPGAQVQADRRAGARRDPRATRESRPRPRRPRPIPRSRPPAPAENDDEPPIAP